MGRAGFSDLEIHILPKQVDQSGDHSSSGVTFHSSEHWTYDVTIENRSFKQMDGLEVRYVIFYKQEKLASREPPVMRRQKGNIDLGSLKSHEKRSVSTNSVELKKSNLSGDYYYPGNERQKAQDTLSGLWVRVYQNGQQIAEYANPSTLLKEKWD